MATYDDKWFECWYDGGSDPILPAYILFVMPAPDEQSGYVVVDFLKNKEVIFRADSYQEVKDWLNEDEYQQIDGRVFVDDGW